MRGAMAVAASLVAGALLAGCASRPAGILIPVQGTVPGTSSVQMIVATTRAAVQGGDLYGGDRARAPGFAEITVSIPPDGTRPVGDVQWPKSVPGNPQTDFVTTEADIVTQKQAEAWFNQRIRATPGRRALVFIHGYNNRFEDAVFRFAQIVHDSGTDVVPVLFTWPSRGSLLAYGYDRESASYSRDALEKLLTFMAKDPNVGEISILAHSMGNWVTLEALRQMAIRNGRIPPKIRTVMLAAPDVDVDIFGTQLADMGADRPNFTVFVSQDDKALQVSQKVWGSKARLGQVDPSAEPYRSQFEAEKINVIDLTKLRTGDQLNHGKFAESPEVVQMIGSRLAQGQTLSDGREGVGDRIIQVTTGAAASIGTAAGVIISAPVAVIDPSTRDNFGAQMENLGSTVSGTATSTGSLLTTAPKLSQ
ncbi:alpha/beta hydrolase [Aquabacter cavernae]|uniref:alpha/beta hydrolase n=1 Tax=Aquabacter cavernae TaxID=2496029 RepID=UPI001FE0ADD6|nr:alpha/beta hydrolase [Aquabacter cavernae]